MGIYIQYIYVVLVSEPVRGRSRATELPCFICYYNFISQMLATIVVLYAGKIIGIISFPDINRDLPRKVYLLIIHF